LGRAVVRDSAGMLRPVAPLRHAASEERSFEVSGIGPAARESVILLSFYSSRRRGRPPSHRASPYTSSATVSQRNASEPRAATPEPHRALPMTVEVAQAVAASSFATLGLSVPILRAILDETYSEPTPVQREVIPHVLAGRDVLACAQTGTGKTAAFVLPILQQLATAAVSPGHIRVLVLTPTRELAAQIAERVSVYGRYLGLRHAVIYGGVSQHRQEIALRNRPDLLVATPGRLLDLLQQRLVKLDGVTHFVLDEADRMLDMGFVNDVRRVLAVLPSQRQTLLFSATMPNAIEKLAQSMLVDPTRVSITPAVTTAATVDQSVVFVARADKRALLETVLRDGTVERALVFTRTKHGANRLSEQLGRSGIASLAIHGNKTQGARERALDSFRKGTTRVLVATDVAARGIDVDGISHVINFDLPNVAESYVHRIGRTGRAGAAGRAISFCDRDERSLLADIERFIRRRLPSTADAGRALPAAVTVPVPSASGPEGGSDRSFPQNSSRARPPHRYRGGRFR
jgi:ATP-dependent RNA helicase RhlE